MTLEDFARQCLMTLEQFAKVCMINIVEEHAEAPEQALEPWRRYRLWLYTDGLEKFDLPELELRNIHPFWSETAARDMTGWAYEWSRYPGAARKLEGSTFPIHSYAVDGLHVTAGLTRSTSDHWKDHRTGCLTLDIVGLEMGCSCERCGGGAGTVH